MHTPSMTIETTLRAGCRVEGGQTSIMSDTDDVGSRAVETVSTLTNAWVRTTEHALNSAIEANRAARASVGLEGSNGDELLSGTDSLSYRRLDWTTDLEADRPESVDVGDVVTFSKRIDESDVERFALASGDTNRLHLDEEFAGRSRFGGTIAHGTLVSGLISAALARLPGLTIYLSQETQFRAPVSIGDDLTAVCEVAEDLGDGQFRLTTRVFADETMVIDGEAVVLIDELPE